MCSWLEVALVQGSTRGDSKRPAAAVSAAATINLAKRNNFDLDNTSPATTSFDLLDDRISSISVSNATPTF